MSSNDEHGSLVDRAPQLDRGRPFAATSEPRFLPPLCLERDLGHLSVVCRVLWGGSDYVIAQVSRLRRSTTRFRDPIFTGGGDFLPLAVPHDLVGAVRSTHAEAVTRVCTELGDCNPDCGNRLCAT